MGLDAESLLMLGAGGMFVGAGVYLYKSGFFDTVVGGGPPAGDENPDVGDNPQYTGGYAYYMKKKVYCRDNHLTAAWLRSQNVHVVNYKLFNDGKIYAQVCGGPSPQLILVAVPLQDATSGSVLKGLGFDEYTAPPLELNSTIPIPNPPTANRAIAYAGRYGPFTAQRVYNY